MRKYTYQQIPSQFASLPGAQAALVGRVPIKLHSDEINPKDFQRAVSRFLAPIGIDPLGKPFYHAAGTGVDPYNRENHSRASYRAYADEKYAYTKAGTFPKWVWWGAAAAAIALGVALSLRH